MTTPKKSPTTGRRSTATPASRGSATARPAKRVAPHDVVAALVAEHRYSARLLEILEQQLDLVARGRPLDREAARGVMSYMTEYPDAYHHPREDAMFVQLAKRDPASKKRIAEIGRAHRTIGAAGRALLAALQRERRRAADDSDVASRIGEYIGALREHMAIEERELFPRARRLLDEADLAAIERDFRRVTDPIFEASVRDAYAAYPTLVRTLVEQPAVREFLDALDSVVDSASTLAEVLWSGTATVSTGRPPRARPSAGAAPRRLRDQVDRRVP